MDSEKSINSFQIKKDRLPDYLLNCYFVYQFVNKFSALLLCKTVLLLLLCKNVITVYLDIIIFILYKFYPLAYTWVELTEINANFAYNAPLLFTHKIVSFISLNKYGFATPILPSKYYISRECFHNFFF